MMDNFYNEPLYTKTDVQQAFIHYAASDDILKQVLSFVSHILKQPASDKSGRYSISDLVHIYMAYDGSDYEKTHALHFLSHITGQPLCKLGMIGKGDGNG